MSNANQMQFDPVGGGGGGYTEPVFVNVYGAQESITKESIPPA